MIKAVFFDIDGTLVSFKTHTTSESTRKAINGLRSKGVKTFIATGRHLSVINNVGDLEFEGYITLNGSYCIAGKNDVIYKRCINRNDLRDLLDYMDVHGQFPCIFVREDGMITNCMNQRSLEALEMLDIPQPPICNLKEELDKDVYQLIAFFEEDKEQEIMQILSDCDATRWTSLFADVVPKGSSKRVGIDEVIKYYNISLDETMAFGDGGNDILMLKHVKIGVAMGNAVDDVKQAADYITTSVDDDGILNALIHFGILDK